MSLYFHLLLLFPLAHDASDCNYFFRLQKLLRFFCPRLSTSSALQTFQPLFLVSRRQAETYCSCDQSKKPIKCVWVILKTTERQSRTVDLKLGTPLAAFVFFILFFPFGPSGIRIFSLMFSRDACILLVERE